MTSPELIKLFTSPDSIVKTADFINAGFSKMDVFSLHKKGHITRIRHGYYCLSETSFIAEEQLLSTLIPEAVICMESALFYYGYSDFTPRKWHIAVPRTISRSKLKTDAICFKAYYIPTLIYDLGKTVADINGVHLPIYDRERTICDCFKYRSRLDRETFNKAIHTYINDKQKKIAILSEYAKQMGIYKHTTELMEVMLNV